jgi:hypothetical protein
LKISVAAFFIAAALLAIAPTPATATASPAPSPVSTAPKPSEPPDLAQQILSTGQQTALAEAQAVRKMEIASSVNVVLLQRYALVYYAADCLPHGGLVAPVKFNSADGGKSFTAAIVCRDGSNLTEKLP